MDHNRAFLLEERIVALGVADFQAKFGRKLKNHVKNRIQDVGKPENHPDSCRYKDIISEVLN